MKNPNTNPFVQPSLKEIAQGCLRKQSYPLLKKILCEHVDGVLILRGQVPTYYLKQIAQEVVGQALGVGNIDNQIQVAKSA